MTELHSHILPGIDDGARDLEAAEKLLIQCACQNVDQIALTSHFRSERQSLENFLVRRAQSWEQLQTCLPRIPGQFRFRLGAEVYYSPRLPELEVEKLCLEGTDVLLLELPMTHRPQFLLQTLDALQCRGIQPLIAHVERYPYVREDPVLLARWLEAGALNQINASGLLPDSKHQSFVMKLVSWGLVQVVAGDVHDPAKRPQRLKNAFSALEARLGDGTARQLQENARKLFDGEEPEGPSWHCPRKILGRWI